MPRPSFWRTVLACRCPRCGRGSLFRGLLTLRPACNACGLSFGSRDAGAASGSVFLLGAVVVGFVFWMDCFDPSAWVYAAFWSVAVVPLAFVVMRPLRAVLVAQHYRHGAGEVEP